MWLFDCQDRNEVETLKPRCDDLEANTFESPGVGGERFGDESIFDGSPFLCDLQVAVAVRAFETVMQFGQQGLLGWLFEADFFG